MTRFRGCIDIHSGQVKQIVGGTLKGDDSDSSNKVETNFVSTQSSSHFSQLYRENHIRGTHVIKLGSLPLNDEVALEAIKQWPQGLQIGGGITENNAKYWIDQGASHVIVTSWLFPSGEFSLDRLLQLNESVGKEHIVIDLSCRKRILNGEIRWFVAINKWQTLTKFELTAENFSKLEQYCNEFLVHAADVEGLCNGIDENLVEKLGEWCTIPVTYAGGAKSLDDLDLVQKISSGKVDLTYGSSLDIFGGKLVKFQDCVDWNVKNAGSHTI
ncbi:hypothetical protein WICMUC_005403 [Wickerhamomyces mucosus]|uniref:1-(5-phosphoribosyl)-5-[(5-phosphoribosylamino)methylideneamino] imidazole-4-carboxamide isomerase n=1 Tax=Wickerhamomyces mucosus TaxID=1378264 RepID=A0A9P8T6L6_9ASCO|nr:hypothetical protein WICMUC_005403 [Wickerhamomyces mucosus]